MEAKGLFGVLAAMFSGELVPWSPQTGGRRFWTRHSMVRERLHRRRGRRVAKRRRR